jgi:hypothetical protein
VLRGMRLDLVPIRPAPHISVAETVASLDGCGKTSRK